MYSPVEISINFQEEPKNPASTGREMRGVGIGQDQRGRLSRESGKGGKDRNPREKGTRKEKGEEDRWKAEEWWLGEGCTHREEGIDAPDDSHLKYTQLLLR
jgi:hypothetical protein